MHNGLTNAIMFAAGALVGSAVAWYVTKNKYEAIIQDEIDAAREFYGSKTSTDETEEEEDEDEEDYYEEIIDEQGYNTPETEEEYYLDEERPYVISPDEYGEIAGYDAIELTYYADGVLADDDGNIIEDVDDIVGTDSLNTFGRYEDDSVHVRNDALQCDYEILADMKTYDEVWGSK